MTWKDGKTGYNWASYQWCNGTNTTLTKYNTNSSYGPVVDNKTTLDLADDAARANWGGSWRMLTDAEWTELRTECTWTWTTQNGVNGRLVTGPNGNSIFLPAAGNRYNTYLNSAGSYGYYWSSSLSAVDPSVAYGVYFLSDGVGGNGGDRRIRVLSPSCHRIKGSLGRSPDCPLPAEAGSIKVSCLGRSPENTAEGR